VLDAERVAYEPDALGMIARAADGGLRDALSLADQVLSLGADARVTADRVREALGLVPEDEYLAALDLVAEGRAGEVFAFVGRLAEAGVDFGLFLTGFGDALRALLAVALGGEAPDASETMRQALAERARADYPSRLVAADLVRMLQLLVEAEPRFRKSGQQQLLLETLLVRFALLDRAVSLEAVLRGLGDRGGPGDDGREDGDGGGGSPPAGGGPTATRGPARAAVADARDRAPDGAPARRAVPPPPRPAPAGGSGAAGGLRAAFEAAMNEAARPEAARPEAGRRLPAEAVAAGTAVLERPAAVAPFPPPPTASDFAPPLDDEAGRDADQILANPVALGAAAPPGPAATGAGTPALAARWDEVVAAARAARPLVGTALAATLPVAVSAAGAVTVALQDSNPAFAQAIDSAHEDVLAAVRRVLPEATRVVLRAADGAASTAPQQRLTAEGIRAERLASLARRDPVLNEAITALDLDLLD
jgi:DNA polymerase-3 subunit gamma/tau